MNASRDFRETPSFFANAADWRNAFCPDFPKEMRKSRLSTTSLEKRLTEIPAAFASAMISPNVPVVSSADWSSWYIVFRKAPEASPPSPSPRATPRPNLPHLLNSLSGKIRPKPSTKSWAIWRPSPKLSVRPRIVPSQRTASLVNPCMFGDRAPILMFRAPMALVQRSCSSQTL